MNALTAVKANTDDLAQRHTGFTLAPSAQSPRLLALTFTADTTRQ
ncbi:carbon starvation induced protein, partial [Salmonella enterica subsp. enterica]|nr:carbon starvation induced protein [Salmonella enterica subsp. enterica]